MVLSALMSFYRIADFNGMFPQWCVLVLFRSTLFDNRSCCPLVVKSRQMNRNGIFPLMSIIVLNGGTNFHTTLVS